MTMVFVYGTLKTGKVRHPHMKGATFLREARTAAKYALYQSPGVNYPCLVEDDTQGVSVEGELWEVPDECLARLDVVEGVPRLVSAPGHFPGRRPGSASLLCFEEARRCGEAGVSVGVSLP